MSRLTNAAFAVAGELREIEFCPSVSTQGYEELIKRAAELLEELAWMREEAEA